MVYDNQIMTLLDIPFQTVIHVLKEKQCCKEKSSPLKTKIIWKFREHIPNGTKVIRTVNMEGRFSGAGSSVCKVHSAREFYSDTAGVKKAKRCRSKRPGEADKCLSRTKGNHSLS